MVDENSLSKIIDKSIDPDGLKHCLGIFVDETGKVDWGIFCGLEENCCISLGIEDLRIGKLKPDEIEKILNAYKIPAVSINAEYDTAKILVTDTGIKLPLQKPENALEQINDIVNVLKTNKINIEGYAHPVTKDGITRSTSVRNSEIDCSKFDDIEIKEILERRQTTFDEFVGDRLDEALSKAMSSEDIEDMINSNYMKSLYRGGTLGNQPYATVAARECKDFVYASPSFNTAKGYARGLGAHYKSVNGHQYGFIYEYEISPNQKFTDDFGLERGMDKHNAETLEQMEKRAYETDVYPHQNKLKGIYLSADEEIYKIADENGYISKEWEDFANLHPIRSAPSNPSEITRNNEMYQLSRRGMASSEYNGKTYSLTSRSLDSYIKEQMSTDVVYIGNNGKYVTSYPLILKDIPDGADLSGLESCYLSENVTVGNNVKLPEVVSISGAIPDGADLSNAKNILLGSEVNFGKDVKLPETVISPSNMKIKGYIPDGLDLSNRRSLMLHDIASIGSDVKLPEVISISGTISDGVNLSNAKNIWFNSEINFGNNVKLPEVVSISGAIPDGADLSNAKNILLGSEVNFGKDVKLPETVISSPDMRVGGYIPNGLDLSNCKSLTLHDMTNIGNNVKLPEVVSISGAIPDGADLSSAKNILLGSEVNFGKDVKLPENTNLSEAPKISGHIPDKMNLREVENLTLEGNVTFGKDVKLPENVKFNHAKVSGYIPDGIDLSYSATLTDDVWLGKNCQYGFGCVEQDNPPRIHGHVEYSYKLEKADFSKAESLIFTKNSQAEITKDFIFPENGNVKIEGLVVVDCPETLHKISQYDVNDCIVAFENNKGNPINSLPDNIDILIADKDNKITVIAKNAEGKKHLQEMCEAMFAGNKDLDGMPKISYLTQEQFTKQSGIEFTEAKSLKTEQNIAETSGAKTINETTTKSAEGAVTEVTENATTKSVASEGAELAADATVKTAAAKAATTATEKGAKSGVIETIKAVDDKVNTAIDKTIEKGSEKLNNTKVGKAYAKAEKAVANSTVGKAVNKGVKKVGSAVAKTVQKTGKAVAKTAAGKAVKKAAAKTAGKTAAKAVGKSLLKKIPVLSVGAGLVFGAQRAMAGDWKGAAGEVASGALGTFPGLGTAASVAIDAGLAGRDIYNETHSDEQQNAPTATNQTTANEQNSASLKQQMKTDMQKANNYAAHQQQELQQSSKNNLRSSMQADAKGAKNKYQKQMEELLNTLNASNDNDEDMNVIKTTALLFQKYGNNAYTLLQEAVLRPNSCISLINDNSLKTQQDVVKYLCSANNNQQVIQNILKNHTR